tara:strand:+ start:789 stop:1364 length:576 start_codon:yes stop_codon:yes gene_type:complete
MVNRTKSKRSRYIKSRKFRKYGGGMMKKLSSKVSKGLQYSKGKFNKIKSEAAGSGTKPSSFFKNIQNRFKSRRKPVEPGGPAVQTDPLVVDQQPPGKDVRPLEVVRPPGKDVIPLEVVRPLAPPEAAAKAVSQESPPLPPVSQESSSSLPGEAGDNEGSGAIGGKRNRYKKSKKGGRRTRKSRKLRRSRRR